MKLAFMLSFLLFAVASFAGPPYSVALNTATELDTNYVVVAITGIPYANHFMMVNSGSAGVCCDTQATSLPAASNGHELCIPSSSFFAWDSITINGKIWCRNQASNTGTLTVQAW